MRRLSALALSIAVALWWLVGTAPLWAADDAQPVWLISTRSASHCGEPDDPKQAVCYWRAEADCQWTAADAAAFHATDKPKVPTVVFVHGNRTDADEAVSKGWCAYEGLRAAAAGRPFRFVIWSWPADRMLRRPRVDTQLKAGYSDADSYYLAHWLNDLQPRVPVALVGHSFGPRVIAGALHLLAGGRVACRVLPQTITTNWASGKRNPIRLVLLAAAMDDSALAADGEDGLAVSLAERTLVTVNECDRILQLYSRLYGRGGPDALGFSGPCGASDKIELLDVSCSVGRSHDWQHYCDTLTTCGLWSRYAYLDDATAKPANEIAKAK